MKCNDCSIPMIQAMGSNIDGDDDATLDLRLFSYVIGSRAGSRGPRRINRRVTRRRYYLCGRCVSRRVALDQFLERSKLCPRCDQELLAGRRDGHLICMICGVVPVVVNVDGTVEEPGGTD